MAQEEQTFLFINSAAMNLPRGSRTLPEKIIALPRAIFTNLSVQLDAGNCFWTAPDHNFALWFAGTQTLAAALCAAYESWTGIPRGLPAYAVAGVNAATSALYLSHVNGDDLLALGKDAWSNLYSGGAFAAWTFGNTMRGRREAKKGETPSVSETLFYGGGDLSAVHGHPWATIPFICGIAKAVCQKYVPPLSTKTLWGRVTYEVTSQRLFSGGYAISAMLTVTAAALKAQVDPRAALVGLSKAVGQFLWGVFYFRIGKPHPQQIGGPNEPVLQNVPRL